MQSGQSCHCPPDPPAAGVRTDAKQERQARYYAEADAQLSEVAGGAPDHAERLVRLLAAVGGAVGEWAAFVVGVRQAAALREAGDDNYLPIAPLGKTILYSDPGVQHLRVIDDEPIWAASRQNVQSKGSDDRKKSNNI